MENQDHTTFFRCRRIINAYKHFVTKQDFLKGAYCVCEDREFRRELDGLVGSTYDGVSAYETLTSGAR